VIFGVGYGAVGAPVGSVVGHSLEGTLGFHLRGLPILLSLGGSVGSYHVVGEGDWAAFFTWRTGVAFAPFQGPLPDGSGASPLNPFVGVDALGLYFDAPHGCGPLCGAHLPSNAILPALSAGDVIFVGNQSFVFRVSATGDADGFIGTASVELPGLLALLIAAEL